MQNMIAILLHFILSISELLHTECTIREGVFSSINFQKPFFKKLILDTK